MSVVFPKFMRQATQRSARAVAAAAGDAVTRFVDRAPPPAEPPELPESVLRELETMELVLVALHALEDRGARERVMLWVAEQLGIHKV